MIYLDYNATTPLRPEAQEAMEPYWGNRFGNASSVHSYGQEAMQGVLQARDHVADLVGAQRDEVIFTGSGTEAVVLGTVGAARANRQKGNHVLVSAVEHSAALGAGRLCRELGFDVTAIPCDPQGRITPETLMAALTELEEVVKSLGPYPKSINIISLKVRFEYSIGIYESNYNSSKSFPNIPLQ